MISKNINVFNIISTSGKIYHKPVKSKNILLRSSFDILADENIKYNNSMYYFPKYEVMEGVSQGPSMPCPLREGF